MLRFSMDVGQAIFVLTFFFLAGHTVTHVETSICGNKILHQVFDLSPSVNEFNLLIKLLENVRSVIVKWPRTSGAPVRVIVRPQDFDQFYRRSRELKIYRSHSSLCIDPKKLHLPSSDLEYRNKRNNSQQGSSTLKQRVDANVGTKKIVAGLLVDRIRKSLTAPKVKSRRIARTKRVTIFTSKDHGELMTFPSVQKRSIFRLLRDVETWTGSLKRKRRTLKNYEDDLKVNSSTIARAFGGKKSSRTVDLETMKNRKERKNVTKKKISSMKSGARRNNPSFIDDLKIDKMSVVESRMFVKKQFNDASKNLDVTTKMQLKSKVSTERNVSTKWKTGRHIQMPPRKIVERLGPREMPKSKASLKLKTASTVNDKKLNVKELDMLRNLKIYQKLHLSSRRRVRRVEDGNVQRKKRYNNWDFWNKNYKGYRLSGCSFVYKSACCGSDCYDGKMKELTERLKQAKRVEEDRSEKGTSGGLERPGGKRTDKPENVEEDMLKGSQKFGKAGMEKLEKSDVDEVEVSEGSEESGPGKLGISDEDKSEGFGKDRTDKPGNFEQDGLQEPLKSGKDEIGKSEEFEKSESEELVVSEESESDGPKKELEEKPGNFTQDVLKDSQTEDATEKSEGSEKNELGDSDVSEENHPEEPEEGVEKSGSFMQNVLKDSQGSENVTEKSEGLEESKAGELGASEESESEGHGRGRTDIPENFEQDGFNEPQKSGKDEMGKSEEFEKSELGELVVSEESESDGPEKELEKKPGNFTQDVLKDSQTEDANEKLEESEKNELGDSGVSEENQPEEPGEGVEKSEDFKQDVLKELQKSANDGTEKSEILEVDGIVVLKESEESESGELSVSEESESEELENDRTNIPEDFEQGGLNDTQKFGKGGMEKSKGLEKSEPVDLGVFEESEPERSDEERVEKPEDSKQDVLKESLGSENVTEKSESSKKSKAGELGVSEESVSEGFGRNRTDIPEDFKQDVLKESENVTEKSEGSEKSEPGDLGVSEESEPERSDEERVEKPEDSKQDVLKESLGSENVTEKSESSKKSKEGELGVSEESESERSREERVEKPEDFEQGRLNDTQKSGKGGMEKSRGLEKSEPGDLGVSEGSEPERSDEERVEKPEDSKQDVLKESLGSENVTEKSESSKKSKAGELGVSEESVSEGFGRDRTDIPEDFKQDVLKESENVTEKSEGSEKSEPGDLGVSEESVSEGLGRDRTDIPEDFEQDVLKESENVTEKSEGSENSEPGDLGVSEESEPKEPEEERVEKPEGFKQDVLKESQKSANDGADKSEGPKVDVIGASVGSEESDPGKFEVPKSDKVQVPPELEADGLEEQTVAFEGDEVQKVDDLEETRSNVKSKDVELSSSTKATIVESSTRLTEGEFHETSRPAIDTVYRLTSTEGQSNLDEVVRAGQIADYIYDG